MDLEGSLREASIEEYLKTKEIPGASGVDQKKLAGLLAGVRGLRLGIRIGEKPFGKLVVDFADDASMTAPFAKPLLLQVLADVGASIGDLAEWKPGAVGKTVSLEGYLTPDGLRRALSVIEPPSAVTLR